RYGYLVPNPSPGSEMAKSQDLLLKERARRMVQIEEQQDADSLRAPRQTDGITEARSSPCLRSSEGTCAPLATDRAGHLLSSPEASRKDPAAGYPDSQQPSRPAPRLLQAEGTAGELPFDNAVILQNVSGSRDAGDFADPRTGTANGSNSS